MKIFAELRVTLGVETNPANADVATGGVVDRRRRLPGGGGR